MAAQGLERPFLLIAAALARKKPESRGPSPRPDPIDAPVQSLALRA